MGSNNAQNHEHILRKLYLYSKNDTIPNLEEDQWSGEARSPCHWAQNQLRRLLTARGGIACSKRGAGERTKGGMATFQRRGQSLGMIRIIRNRNKVLPNRQADSE